MPLKLLNASAEAAVINIERLISEPYLTEKGIYLPPKNLKNNTDSLVFIPETPKTPIPTLEETNEKLLTNPNEKTGVLVTPPGATLSRLFEEELGFSFTKIDLNQIQNRLPKILVEDMELAENAQVQIQGNTVILEITGSIFNEICHKPIPNQKPTNKSAVFLSSAIACTLAKATGKPLTIQNETRNQETKTTHIEYQILEDYPAIEEKPILEHVILETKTVHIERPTFESETTQLPSLTVSEKRLNEREISRSVSEDSVLNTSGIEIDPNALSYLKRNGEVFVLTDAQFSQDSSCMVKGYDAEVIFKFEEFVEVCKTLDDSQNRVDSPQIEYSTRAFELGSPSTLRSSNLGFYAAKSGFLSVDDWLRTLKVADEIPECSTGHKKLLLMYHISINTK